MEKLYLSMLCAILLITPGCSNESLVDEQKVDEQGTGDKYTVVSFTAKMPGEGPQTRIGLEREDLDIKLIWEVGDELEVCLQHGEMTEIQTIKATNISEDGKTADFSVEIPQGIETFNLYGIYGGGGLDKNDPTKAKLSPAESYISGSLDDLKTSKAVMLAFAETGIETTAANLLLDLKHEGSLFCIQLKNGSKYSWDNIKKVQLSAGTPIGVYGNTAVLDLAMGTISGTASGNELTFELSEATNLASGGEQEFWGWFVPVADQNWPEINLKVLNASDTELAVSTNSKSARGSVTAVGKAFYFPAVYNGTDLNFIQAGTLKDIEGNVYTTVVIGDLEWMTENLKVTRYRNGDLIATGLSNAEWAATNNERLGAYAIYPYTETNGMVGSEAEMIAKYGLLYNGFAVEDARGLAPEGWRVATDEDFKNLEYIVGMSEAVSDGTAWRGSDGDRFSLKLRSTAGWDIPGTDDVGFKALPAGVRTNNGSYSSFWGAQSRVMFWTSTNAPGTDLRGFRRLLQNNNRHTIFRDHTLLKQEGISVRCVRDK
ncbi:fibrobacter succinogenes major paralogous domain-containing protein [Proteiniphilum sp. UBA5384]|uniref:fibrobacter succinogenes major paralogous domain-containing protein n=1 Tax=Proteiniphilum sp. UBA5384 TaxID=1947279 RepID=UPI0025D2EF31|nr:fibrobacter succinogenes major paralogous domain-containing protein [Proteiniphilum sp. UBA5384]